MVSFVRITYGPIEPQLLHIRVAGLRRSVRDFHILDARLARLVGAGLDADIRRPAVGRYGASAGRWGVFVCWRVGCAETVCWKEGRSQYSTMSGLGRKKDGRVDEWTADRESGRSRQGLEIGDLI